MRSYLIEACVESIEEALIACQRGADQIELCARLDVDGLTPELEIIRLCADRLSIPLKVMLRHREGHFVYDLNDKAELFRQLNRIKEFPVKGLVFGAIAQDGQLDFDLICEIRDRAYPREICLHKAIDSSSDILLDLDRLKQIGGIAEILSSGGAVSAREGVRMLSEMRDLCGESIRLIGAGAIRPDNLQELHDKLGLRAYHGRHILGSLSVS